MSARDAVIVDAVRTPVGKRNGSLAGIHAVDLSAHVLTALAARNGLDPAAVDDVIWGCVQQVGQQGGNVARMAVLAAGWPESVPGTTVDRQCGSSQQSVHFAAAGLVSGQYDVAIAGGVEIMSAVPLGALASHPDLGRPGGPKVRERYGVTFNQGLGAEMMAEKWGLSRAPARRVLQRLPRQARRRHRRGPAGRPDRPGRHRPPARRFRRPADDRARPSPDRPGHPLRPADHVRGRRPGQRHHGARLTIERIG